MINYQHGSFQIQSLVMLNILEDLKINAHKKFFVIVGDVGSGKSTMLNYINKTIFGCNQIYMYDELDLPSQKLGSAIVTLPKEAASKVVSQFDKNETHIIEMPNLCDRKADILNFSIFFIEVLALMNNQKPVKLTEKAIEKLLQYNWPGNFHELEATLELAFERYQKTQSKAGIEPDHIEINVVTKELQLSIGQKLEEVERKYILQTLYFVQQNRTKAAEILGISIRTLRNKINLYREEGYL